MPPPPPPRSTSWSWGRPNGSSRPSSPSYPHTYAPSRFKPTGPPRFSGAHGPSIRLRPYGSPTPPPQPYARVQQQRQMTRDRNDSAVPIKGLEKMVVDNNAFLFAQSLLAYLKNATEYWRLQEYRQIETLIEGIVSALSTHPDPPMFIINALITIGTVAGFRTLDPEFELLVSVLLAESLQRYLTWQRDLSEEHGNNSSGSSPLEYQGDGDEDDKDSGSGSDDTSVSAAGEGQFDLIVLDDDEDSPVQASLRARSPHANIEPPVGTMSTALDDSSVIPEIDGNKVLKPTVLDLIDFSSWDRLETPSVTGSTDSSVDSKGTSLGWQVMKAATKPTGATPKNPMDDDEDSETETTGGLMEINLEQLDGVKTMLKEDVRREKKSGRSDIAELIHIFDSHLYTDSQETSDGDGEGDNSALDRGEADDENEDTGDSIQDEDDLDDDDVDGPIRSHHRQKLKEEITTGKNPLQVFVALDVIDMHKALRRIAPRDDDEDSSETYGTLLAHQLLQKDRYRECIIVLSKDMGLSVGVEQALLSRLLELGHEEIIYIYIENDLERCRRVLLSINHQLSFQFYYWGLATADMARSDPPEYADVSPIAGVGRAKVQTRLVETAMGLIMYFDLEEDQPSYKFLDLFARFCTVSTLLNQSSPAANSLHSNESTQGPNKTQAAAGIELDNGSKRNGKEYLLTTAWRYVPLVLEITRGSATLQRMTIQHCVERRDLITAKFLASKLDIMEYYLEIAESDSGASSIPAAVKAIHPGSPLPEAALAAAAPGQVTLYRLPNETKTIFVKQAHQLESMSAVLERSRIVGMDTEWLPNIPEFRNLQRKLARTAIIQLASDVDSMVFLVDAVAFLEGPDGGKRLVQVLGSMFHNPKIRKLAFDWDGDQELLETTFPEMQQPQNRLQNFMDLKYLWFKIRVNGEESNSDNNSSSHNNNGSKGGPGGRNGNGNANSALMAGRLESWSSLTPNMKEMVYIPGGLSGLLARICGHKLDKSEQCSQWEQRPLTKSQLNYAAADAKCLLEIYAALMTIEQV